MMKQLLTILAFFAVVEAGAQCSPDTAITNNFPLDPTGELEPDAFYAYPGQFLDLLITALPPQEVDAGIGFNVPLNWVRVTSLQNAPTWLGWDCGGQYNPSDPCQMAYPTWTCVNAYSTAIDGRVPLTETVGTIYTMDVIVDADVNIVGSISGQNGGQLSLLILDSMTNVVTGNNPSCGGQGTASAAPAGGFGDPGAYVYEWNNGMTTQTINNLGPGWYICTVTDQVTGWSAIDSVEIVSPPAIVITVDGQTDEIVGNDGTVSISASGGTGALTYSWSGPNGFTSTSEDLTGLEAGLYTLTVTDAQGCTSIQSVNILSQMNIEDLSVLDFEIFPNPSNGVFTMTFNNTTGKNIELIVLDMEGRKVYSEMVQGGVNRKEMNLEGLGAGNYLMQVNAGSYQRTSRIILK